MDNEKRYQLLEKLSNAFGAPCFEEEVHNAAKEFVKDFADTSSDSLFNLYIKLKKNTGDKPVLLLDAHSDEVAFMAQSFLPNGLIKFVAVGSWVVTALPSQTLRIRCHGGKYITGVITTKPVHFATAEDKEPQAIEKLTVDVGASRLDELYTVFNISPGVPMVPAVSMERTKNGLAFGKAFDCRVGCCALLDAMEQLSKLDLPVDVIGVLSSQEEVGGRGAGLAARRVHPDIALVFEGSPADDSFTPEWEAQCAINKGVQLRHIDRTAIAHPGMISLAKEVATSKGIKFQEAVRRGGGTNSAHYTNLGVPNIVLGVPVRYAHSHYGFTSLDDCKATSDLAVALAPLLSPDVIQGFRDGNRGSW
ncbi:MAG: M20/M25/M40 family metallo-hydrolase [Clostridiales bacterium]|nr:M20/M25/M40 family metallo-hydrolase [Clostridiales bacterium]